jgi:hypothetical protein
LSGQRPGPRLHVGIVQGAIEGLRRWVHVSIEAQPAPVQETGVERLVECVREHHDRPIGTKCVAAHDGAEVVGGVGAGLGAAGL